MIARENEGTGIERQLTPDGMHAAVCQAVCGIGWQPGSYANNPTLKNEVILVWEIPSIRIKTEEHCQSINGFYNLTLGSQTKPSKLRKLLEGWRGAPFSTEQAGKFDMQNILGKPVNLIIRHKQTGTSTRDYVDGAMRFTNTQQAPQAERELCYFDFCSLRSELQQVIRAQHDALSSFDADMDQFFASLGDIEGTGIQHVPRWILKKCAESVTETQAAFFRAHKRFPMPGELAQTQQQQPEDSYAPDTSCLYDDDNVSDKIPF